MSTKLSPEQLAGRCLADVINEHGHRLLGLAFSILNNEEDAEEALQDAWMKVYQSLLRGEELRALARWLTTVVANASKDVYRKRRREAKARAESLSDKGHPA